MTKLDSRLSIALEFVRIGYGDIINDAPFRSLYFQTDTLTTSEAKAVLEIVGGFKPQVQKVQRDAA